MGARPFRAVRESGRLGGVQLRSGVDHESAGRSTTIGATCPVIKTPGRLIDDIKFLLVKDATAGIPTLAEGDDASPHAHAGLVCGQLVDATSAASGRRPAGHATSAPRPG